jgi:hydrogenase-4 component B
MSSVYLVLLGAGLMAVSGLPACLMPSRWAAGQRLSAILLCAGSVAGLSGAGLALALDEVPVLSVPWSLPFGAFRVSADPLSASFLLLVFLIPALGSVYALGYWKQSEHPDNGRRLGAFYGLLAGGMAMVVVARDAVLFLMAWETMALSAYFAASAEDDKSEVRKAGWIYLVATHVGTLILIAMFGLWRNATGSFSLEAAASIPLATAGLIFALAVLGFGFKAGIMPLHVWLPGAHANAPSHVSAVMSGVMLKMGIYGIARICWLFPAGEAWWGIALLSAGAISGILGIAFAAGQTDLKRVLAYSSVENVGIIVMGLGLALLGRAYGRADLVLLGSAGALLHVWNHGLFKSLLFFGSGAVVHAAGTRDIELLGGLAKKMPLSSALFALGSVAICALPPLNGFAGEWLLYLGFFRSIDPSGASGLALAGCCAAALAAIGALAVAVFVRLYGTVFLGSPRSDAPGHARDPGSAMLAPMAALALACAAAGLLSPLASPLLEKVTRSWMPSVDIGIAVSDLAPQAWISALGLGLAALVLALALWRRLGARKGRIARGVTWDCGYAEPSPRMQYSGTSLGQGLVRLFSFALFPRTEFRKPLGAFPEKAEFRTSVADSVLDRIVMPFFKATNRLLPKMRVFQQGQTHLYVLYVVIITIALFALGGIGAGQ